MSNKRNDAKKKRRSDRLHEGKVLAGVIPAAPLQGIVDDKPAPALTAVEQAKMADALGMYAVFEKEIVEPIRALLLRAAVVNACRGLKAGLTEGTADIK